MGFLKYHFSKKCPKTFWTTLSYLCPLWWEKRGRERLLQKIILGKGKSRERMLLLLQFSVAKVVLLLLLLLCYFGCCHCSYCLIVSYCFSVNVVVVTYAQCTQGCL